MPRAIEPVTAEQKDQAIAVGVAVWFVARTGSHDDRFKDFMAEVEADAEAGGSRGARPARGAAAASPLARQLAAQRRALHLTQKQLADRVGIDQVEISRIEQGQANPTTATLGTLTRALGTSPTRSDDRSPL